MKNEDLEKLVRCEVNRALLNIAGAIWFVASIVLLFNYL